MIGSISEGDDCTPAQKPAVNHYYLREGCDAAVTRADVRGTGSLANNDHETRVARFRLAAEGLPNSSVSGERTELAVEINDPRQANRSRLMRSGRSLEHSPPNRRRRRAE
jgi:hypothetical protein